MLFRKSERNNMKDFKIENIWHMIKDKIADIYIDSVVK